MTATAKTTKEWYVRGIDALTLAEMRRYRGATGITDAALIEGLWRFRAAVVAEIDAGSGPISWAQLVAMLAEAGAPVGRAL